MPKTYAIILAAGTGERARHYIPKQYIKVAGKMIIEYTLDVFEKNVNIDEIIILVNPASLGLVKKIVFNNKYKKIKKVMIGGKTRMDSARIGVNSIKEDDSYVLIHDAVRPFVSDRIIDDCVKGLKKYDAIDVAIAPADTIIRVDENMNISDIPDRRFMMRGQTPQAFKAEIIKKAHQMAARDKITDATDDCSLILKYRLGDVRVVEGAEENIKITYLTDVFLADKLFQLKSISLSRNISLKRIKGKVVVIFGASRGIGRAIAAIAKRQGAKVYGFSRHNSIDISSAEDVNRALEIAYRGEGRIDYIINTAGVIFVGKIEKRSYHDISTEVDTNYIGAINIIKQGVKYLKESRGGILLFTSSSYTRGRALYSVYSSTKAAIVNLMQGISEELEADGIRINAINPERTATSMRFKNFGNESREQLLSPECVAASSLETLLSDMTGQVVDIKNND